MRLTNSLASRNLKVVLESAAVFIRWKLGLAFVNFICSLMPGSKDFGTLHISLCILLNVSISLLCFCPFHLSMNPVFLDSAFVGSQGNIPHILISVAVCEMRYRCVNTIRKKYFQKSPIVIKATDCVIFTPLRAKVH